MIKTIQEAICQGYWPAAKRITKDMGDIRLEVNGWPLFYRGKNADLYFIPGFPPKMLMIRTDRTSVFNIPLSLEIPGKGEIQNQISVFSSEFAERISINTTISDDFPNWFPDDLKMRGQIVEMCKPLLLNGNTGMELIFRKYLTGSLYKELKAGNDPYKLFLEKDLPEWHEFPTPIFTPTTKCNDDLPLPHHVVTEAYRDLIMNYLELFIAFSEYAYNQGLVVVDTKFEAFVNSECKIVLGDEILTPESSRFILREDFENGIYKSADKQIIRDIGTKNGWKEKAKNLKNGELLNVTITQEEEQQVLDGYQEIYNRLVA